MDLSNFKPFPMVSGKSFITISKNGVAFSQAAVAELQKSEYVIVLFDTLTKQMAVKVADKNENNATSFFTPNKKTLGIRWNNTLLKEKISSMMNWNLTKHSYKVDGNFDESSNALIFDFTTAREN